MAHGGAAVEIGSYSHFQTQNGCTALISAAELGHIDCVRLLVEAGADVNTQIYNVCGHGIACSVFESMCVEYACDDCEVCAMCVLFRLSGLKVVFSLQACVRAIEFSFIFSTLPLICKAKLQLFSSNRLACARSCACKRVSRFLCFTV